MKSPSTAKLPQSLKSNTLLTRPSASKLTRNPTTTLFQTYTTAKPKLAIRQSPPGSSLLSPTREALRTTMVSPCLASARSGDSLWKMAQVNLKLNIKDKCRIEAVSLTDKKIKDHLSQMQKQVAQQHLVLRPDYFSRRAGKQDTSGLGPSKSRSELRLRSGPRPQTALQSRPG